MRVGRRGERYVEVSLGDVTVTVLSDGYLDTPGDRLLDRRGAPLPKAEVAEALTEAGGFRLPVFAFFVRGPEGSLLIDAGTADAWVGTLGRLPEAMAEAGIAPDEVADIALTHTHIDHIGGIVARDGCLGFPKLRRIFVPAKELGLFRAAPRMAPALPLVVPIQPGEGPVPGVVAVGAEGHEMGHMAYLVGGRLLVWGDVVHVAGVQFARPEVTWRADKDQDAARATRAVVLRRVVDEGLAVAGAHLDWPGIGHVRAAGGGAYAFEALG